MEERTYSIFRAPMVLMWQLLMPDNNYIPGIMAGAAVTDLTEFTRGGFTITVRPDESNKDMVWLGIVRGTEGATFRGTYPRCISWAWGWALVLQSEEDDGQQHA